MGSLGQVQECWSLVPHNMASLSQDQRHQGLVCCTITSIGQELEWLSHSLASQSLSQEQEEKRACMCQDQRHQVLVCTNIASLGQELECWSRLSHSIASLGQKLER